MQRLAALTKRKILVSAIDKMKMETCVPLAVRITRSSFSSRRSLRPPLCTAIHRSPPVDKIYMRSIGYVIPKFMPFGRFLPALSCSSIQDKMRSLRGERRDINAQASSHARSILLVCICFVLPASSPLLMTFFPIGVKSSPSPLPLSSSRQCIRFGDGKRLQECRR